MSEFWYMAIALSGMALGAGIRDLWLKATTKPKTRDAVGPLEPRCQCGHDYTSHKRNGGACREDRVEWVNHRQEVWECACIAYLGWSRPTAPGPVATPERDQRSQGKSRWLNGR